MQLKFLQLTRLATFHFGTPWRALDWTLNKRREVVPVYCRAHCGVRKHDQVFAKGSAMKMKHQRCGAVVNVLGS